MDQEFKYMIHAEFYIPVEQDPKPDDEWKAS